MVKQNTLFLICCTTLVSVAQDISFSEVKKLPQNINSGCEEIFPLLAPDKKNTLFLCDHPVRRTAGESSLAQIFGQVKFESINSRWSKPSNAGLFNDKSNNALVGISFDGEIIYQLNTSPNKKTPGIYLSKRLKNSWTQPQLIPLSFLNTQGFLGLHVAPDFSVILISMETQESSGQEDLYVSLKNESGEWSEPRNLGPTINTEGFEISPFLSASKKRLYFTSSGHWGLGDGDIFYSDRLDDTWEKWSPPVNLGNQVNSKSFDAYFSIYDSVAYFSSNREGRFSDLYQLEIQDAEDSIQQQIKKIVAEANSILVDLGDDTTDSLAADFRSVFIEFDLNSVQMNNKAIAQLNSVVDCIQKLKSTQVTLVGYASEPELQTDKLCSRRLEVIRNYLKDISAQNLIVDLELKKQESKILITKNGVVEVRYCRVLNN